MVAGRCHSADSVALASSRVTVTCMGMGQAAGTATAMALANGGDVRAVGVTHLQNRLIDRGAIILDRAEKILRVGDRMENKPVSAVR